MSLEMGVGSFKFKEHAVLTVFLCFILVVQNMIPELPVPVVMPIFYHHKL